MEGEQSGYWFTGYSVCHFMTVVWYVILICSSLTTFSPRNSSQFVLQLRRDSISSAITDVETEEGVHVKDVVLGTVELLLTILF